MDRMQVLDDAHWLIERGLCLERHIEKYMAELFQNLENRFAASQGDEKTFVDGAFGLGCSINQVAASPNDFYEKAEPWAIRKYGKNYLRMMSALIIIYVAEHGWAWHAHEGAGTEKALLWKKILDCLIANTPTA